MRRGIVGGFALLGVACVLIVLAVASSFRAERWVEHSLELQQSTWELFSLVQDAETGQRGYLLTGDRTYLTPFLDAKTQLPEREARLRSMVALSPEREAQQTQLFNLIASKMDELERTVHLRDAGEMDAAFAVVKGDAGRQWMVQIRSIVTNMDRAEQQMLRQRTAAMDQQRFLLMIAVILAIGMASALTYMVIREGQQHATALRHSVHALEQEIGQREDVEAQLRQAQKMEAIGHLTGGVAHDFNNMLAIIIGNLELLLRRLPEGDARLQGPANNALNGAVKAGELTRQLLAFARQQALQPKPTDINQSIRDMSALLRRSLGESIRIETVQAGGLWPAFVDRAQLESALINLAVNSRDAMNGSGKLTIETANTVLDRIYAQQHVEVTAGQYVMVAVTDTGGGMTADVMQKAFDPFFTTKELGKGTGLGLSQVHGFIKQSHGHIKIYSEIGVGTTVKLYLPRDFSETLDEESFDRREDEQPARHKVLVVEDDHDVRVFVVNALREIGYTTVDVPGAEAALHAMDEHPDIKLMLTDVVMPGMNGRQLAARAREMRPDLVVVYMTGYTRNAIVHNGILDPGVRLISKPFTLSELGRELATAIREGTGERV
ncbi:CHASE3 domain-containing protein [Dyella sp. C11]|uniref:CHASE3 domain-containing protein n=1 Tax=Dyella sp. C11 TaxID=2126991 RepID=UPI0018E548AB|nr:CHASE3 domain-containing protein [Dyella sp. C11]